MKQQNNLEYTAQTSPGITSNEAKPMAKSTKYKMKTLKHNGIYVPPYDYKGFTIKIQDQPIKLTPKTEQMAMAWVKKAQSQTSPPDKVYYRNFIQDFIKALQTENPSLAFLKPFLEKHVENVEKGNIQFLINEATKGKLDIDFSEITSYLAREQARKLNRTKEEKRKLTLERKAKREELKEKYGHAEVDGRRLEIANWTAEPSCIFAGRGNHPKRGKWKEGPRQEDIILNLSDTRHPPPGRWKDVVWQPEMMYLAKWDDKLSGKVKYVWFSDSAFLKQNREKEKFQKAYKLGKEIPKIATHIIRNLDSEDEEKRKIATVCWLLLELNMRVGDEKDPGEVDTVGAITLRPEHVKIGNGTLQFDFLGKDCVEWVKEAKAPPIVIKNIQHFMEMSKNYLFEGIDSKRVSRFLSEAMKGLTAKVFRTWKCTDTVKEYLNKANVKQDDPEYIKKFMAKMANLKAAMVANHKRKVPLNFDERLTKKETALKQLETTMKDKTALGKKTETLARRIDKSKLDIKLMKETREYNLGTSLKSYIDPQAYAKWAAEVDFDLDKFYPKTLQKKFSWALGKH